MQRRKSVSIETRSHEYTTAYRNQLATFTVMLTLCGGALLLLMPETWLKGEEYQRLYRDSSVDLARLTQLLLLGWRGLLIFTLAVTQIPTIIGAYLYFQVYAGSFYGTMVLLFFESLSIVLVVLLRWLLVLGVSYQLDGFQ